MFHISWPIVAIRDIVVVVTTLCARRARQGFTRATYRIAYLSRTSPYLREQRRRTTHDARDARARRVRRSRQSVFGVIFNFALVLRPGSARASDRTGVKP